MAKKKDISVYDNSDKAYKYYNRLAEHISVNNTRVSPEQVGEKLAEAFGNYGLDRLDRRKSIDSIKSARRWLEVEYHLSDPK